jgi:hypothetical protein
MFELYMYTPFEKNNPDQNGAREAGSGVGAPWPSNIKVDQQTLLKEEVSLWLLLYIDLLAQKYVFTISPNQCRALVVRRELQFYNGAPVTTA